MLHEHSRIWIVAVLSGSVALGLILAIWLARIVSKPLHGAVAVARRVAHGDLAIEIEESSKDEMGQLMQALKDMNASLIRIVGEVRTTTGMIGIASSKIVEGNKSLSASTEHHASTLEETASSMEQLTASVTQNAENANQARQLTLFASDVASKGGQVVSQMIERMAAIRQSSSKIVDIIDVIDGIAFQTNILALNAAVEAARAGPQGAGFAVVAAEVRQLAKRSSVAAREIKHLIDESVQEIEEGNALAEHASDTMKQIIGGVERVTGIVNEIAAASREQGMGISSVNQAIIQLDQLMQQNALLAGAVVAAAEAMKGQAGELARAVSIFKLGRDEASMAVSISGLGVRKALA